MIALSWNCRGLGNPRAVRTLKELVHKEVPNVVFLIETKLPDFKFDFKLDRIRRLCHFDSCFAVSSRGKSGGLAMLWDNTVSLELITFLDNHIDMIVDEKIGSDKWRMTGFYG